MPERPKVLLADPAWLARDQLPGNGRGATKKYRCMPVEQIERFPIPEMAPTSVLFLWRVAWAQQEALNVVRAWGFTLKSECVWVKTKPCKACKETGQDLSTAPGCRCPKCGGNGWLPHTGLGHYVRMAHETCLIAAKGSGASGMRLVKDVPSVIFASPPKVEGTNKIEHSAKPDAIYELIERLFPGPYHEMFARRRRSGWTQEGDELPEENAAE